MALPALKKCIYMHNPACNVMEALLNVMQATFLVMRSAPTLDNDILSKGDQVFCSLYSQYFDEIPREKVGHKIVAHHIP